MQTIPVIFNEDFDHFFVNRTDQEMTLAGLEAFVDQYVGTGVTELYFCPNGMKANYDSKVMDPIWKGLDEDSYWPSAKRFLSNCRILHERGINPYTHWCKYAREKGFGAWLTVRMNDVHFTDQPNAYTLSSFWKNRPDLRRVEDTVHTYADMALDYEKQEVQDYYFALIQELLELTDPDGIELDWMRFVYHFKAGRERFGQAALAAFLFKVRGLTLRYAAKRGHEIKISVRVPNHLATARALGLDAVAWAKAGLVDQIVLSQFFGTADHDVPLEVWKEALGEEARRVKVAVCVDYNMRSGAAPGMVSVHPRVPFYRGWASAAAHRGADALYLFNYQYLHDSERKGVTSEERAAYGAFLKELARPGELEKGERQYPVMYSDVAALGMAVGHLLPAEASLNRFYRFRLYTGPTAGKVRIILGLGEKPGVHEAVFQARLNSVILGPGKDETVGPVYPGCVRLVSFEAPSEALLEGHNLVEFVLKSEAAQVIMWVEMRLGGEV
jgi:hypothetical protein